MVMKIDPRNKSLDSESAGIGLARNTHGIDEFDDAFAECVVRAEGAHIHFVA